jgi:LacI family transcriptional regulator, repressor for deo operon, udp, cdd, tsx, nupC, and nupG
MNILEHIQLDLRHGLPLAQQIKEQIVWLVASGRLQPGDLLPTVRLLSKHLGVNINTVRNAYQKLEAEGLVATRQGSGTRVLPGARRSLLLAEKPQRSHMVGVLVPSITNPFYHAILDGINEMAAGNSTLVLIGDFHDDSHEAELYFTRFLAKKVDGVIACSLDDAELLQPEPERPGRTRVVCIDWVGSKGCVVNIDLEDAGYQAARHLVQHGHERIGLITFELDFASSNLVNQGYLRALSEAGISPEKSMISRVNAFGMEAGEAGCRELLSLPRPPTAILTITDLLAAGAMRAIRSKGLRLPQDIALASLNDIPLAELVDPPLTSVAFPSRQAGITAMSMLQDLIEGRTPEQREVILPVRLVVRQSCGCAG